MAVKVLKNRPSQRRQSSTTRTVDRTEVMLAAVGRLDGTKAFVVAFHGLDLLCALIRRGCQTATCLKRGMRADKGEYDVVLVPDIASSVAADEAIRTAHRVLAPSGQMVMGLTGDPAAVSRRLRLNGFRSIRTRVFPGYVVVTAEAGRPGISGERTTLSGS